MLEPISLMTQLYKLYELYKFYGTQNPLDRIRKKSFNIRFWKLHAIETKIFLPCQG